VNPETAVVLRSNHGRKEVHHNAVPDLIFPDGHLSCEIELALLALMLSMAWSPSPTLG
jgi:hypothetical protein